MTSHGFDNKPKLYLDRILLNQLSEADCESMLSITCHEKYTWSFNTPKYPIENVWENQLVVIALKCFDERKISLLTPSWHHSNC